MTEIEQAEEIERAITPFFAGKSASVQGAVLADMLALWLAGHVVRGDPEKTERIREEMLRMLLETVRRLIPINYRDHIESKLARL